MPGSVALLCAAMTLLAPPYCMALSTPGLHARPVAYARRDAHSLMLAGSRPRRVLAETLSFSEAREMARAMGFASKDEWDEYDCPGAYRLPKDPDAVWASEWQGWDDWLGVMLPLDAARNLLRSIGVSSEEAYRDLKASGEGMERVDAGAWKGSHALRLRERALPPEGALHVDVGRLPAQPDLFYRGAWKGWHDFLGLGGDAGGDA